MRIVQVNLQPDYGGAENYTLLLANGLRERGHEVSLLCHPQGRLTREAQQRGLPAEAVSVRSQLDLRALARLARSLRSARPDIVHLQTSKDYLCAGIAARWAGVPVVVASRHMLLPVKPGMRLFFRKVDAVVVLSNAVRDNMVRYGVPDAKLNVVYAGIDTAEFVCARGNGSGAVARAAFGVPQDRLLVGMAGRMVEGKGHACLLDAVAQLVNQGVAVTLALVGEGPLRGELEARAAALGIAGEVIFAGFHPNVAAFVASLDLFVMASTCEEVMPLVLMEAMAAGCPVVATRVGGVPEIIEPERTGLVVPPGDANALAVAIRRLEAEPQLRGRLAEAGRAEVLSRFTLPRMVAETERLYERLLKEKAAQSRLPG